MISFRDADVTSYCDPNLTFEIDPRSESLYIATAHLRIRQFVTPQQLIELRDMLIKAFPIEEGVFK